MNDSRLDQLARTLAEPMPRRRALRLAGMALVAALVPALRPRAALADCGKDTLCSDYCHTSPLFTGACGVQTPTGCGNQVNCRMSGGCMVKGQKCCRGGSGATEDAWICLEAERCGSVQGQRCIGCPPDKFICGKECCRKQRPTLPAEVCYQGRCRPACPDKTTKCGNSCCTSKQTCRKGKCCDKCGGNGTCCDPATEYCCREPGDPKSPGRCCKKDKESCCGVGPPGAQKRMCCAKPNKCTRELPRGIGGLTSDSPYVCCPRERQVPVDETQPNDIVACCAPGQVSLGGKLIVGQGVQGSCCDADRICGSGADLTCCQTGESCIGGTTCA